MTESDRRPSAASGESERGKPIVPNPAVVSVGTPSHTASLDRAILNGPPALAAALTLGRGDAVLRNVASDLHRACAELSRDGHIEQAIDRLKAARHTRPDASGQLWNLAVIQVLSVLEAERKDRRRRSLRRPGSR